MSNPTAINKQPSETIIISIDFSNTLGTDTISSINSTTVVVFGGDNPLDLSIDSVAINADSDAVLVTISAGTSGISYQITTIVTTSASEVLEGEAIIVVRELVAYYGPIFLIRNLIYDVGPTPTYSDDRLSDIFLTASWQVNNDLVFGYDIDLEAETIDANALTNDSFVNLATLKAACIIDRGSMRLAAAINGLEAKCGPVNMKVARRADGFALLIDKGYCAAYAEAKLQYSFGNADFARGILSPFVNEEFFPSHFSKNYIDPRVK